jgi:hypothetical protein
VDKRKDQSMKWGGTKLLEAYLDNVGHRNPGSPPRYILFFGIDIRVAVVIVTPMTATVMPFNDGKIGAQETYYDEDHAIARIRELFVEAQRAQYENAQN